MKDPRTIRHIANERLEEARILFREERCDGAFYLAGYSVELALKAKICERFDTPDLFDESCKLDGTKSTHFDSVKRALRIHNLRTLFWLSGYWKEYDLHKATYQQVAIAHSLLIDRWSETCRYDPIGTCSLRDTEKFIEAIGNPEYGIIPWLERI